MRRVRALLPLCGAFACLALTACLSGCTSPEPTQTPSPAESTPAPVFASDEEALAAAEKAYAAYLAMSDLIAQEGGANPERMEAVAVGEALRTAVVDLNEFGTNRVRAVGSTTFRVDSLESVSGTEPVSVVIFVCDDVSSLDVVDGSGHSVVSPERPDVSPFRVEVLQTEGSTKVVSRLFWDGTTFC
jgi:hypothetical protein